MIESGNRLKQLRRALALKQEEMAESIGMKRPAYSKIETGANNFSEVLVMALIETYHVSPTWLFTGEGPMYAPDYLGMAALIQDDDVAEMVAAMNAGKVLKHAVLSFFYEKQELINDQKESQI